MSKLAITQRPANPAALVDKLYVLLANWSHVSRAQLGWSFRLVVERFLGRTRDAINGTNAT